MTGNTNACEILGCPPDARLLIVNADDFGMCHALNEGALRAIKEGLASSCSVMVPAPWGLHAIHLLQENPGIPFGVHLCAVSEYAHYRWRPLTGPARVPSLVDASGYFYRDHRIPELLSRASLDELETEFRAQVDAVLSSGLHPTHLDSHYHVHGLREDVFDLTVDLALEYGLALRVSDEPAIEKLQGRGYPTSDHPILDCGRVELSEKASLFARLLRQLPPGLSEWAIHPGIESEELRAIMSGPGIYSGVWEGRYLDLTFITSEEARRIVREEGIEILDYAPLQEIWQGKTRD